LKTGIFLLALSAMLVACGTTDSGPSPTRDDSGAYSSEATIAPTPENPLNPSPTSAPIHPSVEIIGEPELVFDWSEDRCADNQIPDLPVRAFWDSNGRVQINLSHETNYRMIGPDLDSLEPDCTPTLISDHDPDPAQFSYAEWIGSTYTPDGNTVYALIHNEYYGERGSPWHASRDFSAEQGAQDWFYQNWDGSSYWEMAFDSWNNRWQGFGQWCQVGSTWQHPGSACDAVRTWISPITGRISIGGSFRDADPNGGNGVRVSILHDDRELWSRTIDNGDLDDQSFDLQLEVSEGDAIHFRVNARGNANNDSTAVEIEINTGPDPCQPGKTCHYMSITFAVSDDGGNTFEQPSAPDHLVATLPYPYLPDVPMVANWQPSNIIRHPQDGYYYALVQLDVIRPQEPNGMQGMCLMRNQNLDDPAGWRAWDGTAFEMRFINPFLDSTSNPEDHRCVPVDLPTIGALSYSLTYNAYLGKFIALGHGVNVNPPGFYYSYSDDLIHWSPVMLLMEADLVQNTRWQTPYLAYPSLIDPGDTSRNFEISGQDPYLYFTRVNALSPALDFDLLRVRLHFENSTDHEP